MITGLNHLTLAVTDLERSFAFYHDIIGLKALLVGEFWFCLNVTDTVSPRTDSTHIAFSVSQNDFAGLRDRILNGGAIIWQENKSEGDSLYFCDPDGHKLEIHVGN